MSQPESLARRRLRRSNGLWLDADELVFEVEGEVVRDRGGVAVSGLVHPAPVIVELEGESCLVELGTAGMFFGTFLKLSLKRLLIFAFGQLASKKEPVALAGGFAEGDRVVQY